MAKQRSKKTDKKKENIFKRLSKKYKDSQKNRVRLHKSFKRSYREDYVRDLKVPGIMAHLFETFKIVFKNWKIFGLLMLIVIVCNVVLVGIMNEDTYIKFQNVLDETTESVLDGKLGSVPKAGLLLISTVTTGGLNTNMSEVQGVFAVILFLIIWLATIFILRHTKAGHKINLRDALYNSGSPIISTFVVFGIVVLQCIPIFLFIIGYSTAKTTGFLNTPFYALIFFIFAALMFFMSGYWLSSSLIALVAVTAPGLYPMKAIHTASDLMAGRRMKFIIRLLGLIIALAIIWVVVMLPLILFDMWMKTFEWTAGIPFIPVCLSIMTVFTAIYFTAYLYLYYRWMLDYDKD